MSILDLALIGWGLLLATFVGMMLHGNHKYRSERAFNDHYVGVHRIINESSFCRECQCTYEGPRSSHTCPDGY